MPAALRPLAAMFGPYRKPLKRMMRPAWWGNLRTTEPKSRHFGVDRGTAIDRHYIEAFLGEHEADVRGTVLEVADDSYTRRFGGDRVTRSEVISIAGGAGVTITGDLTRAGVLPADTFDCIIFTQTLCFIFDAAAAIRALHGALKPGGVLLMTVPGISQISNFDQKLTGDFWRFTVASVHRLLASHFAGEAIAVRSYGNVLSATGLLHGVSKEEVSARELDVYDPMYQVIIAARAVRA